MDPDEGKVQLLPASVPLTREGYWAWKGRVGKQPWGGDQVAWIEVPVPPLRPKPGHLPRGIGGSRHRPKLPQEMQFASPAIVPSPAPLQLYLSC